MTAAQEAAEEAYPALNPDDEDVTYPRSAVRELVRGAFVRGWNAALEAARNEILDVTKVIDGEEYVFADDVVFDLKSLEDRA